jgi:proline iminopeptidase
VRADYRSERPETDQTERARHENGSEVYCQIAGRDADLVIAGDMASVDFRRRLREIKSPALVLAGRFDRVAIPRYSAQFRTFMPQAEFHWFEHSGHFPFVEEPAFHDDIVRAFLRK